MNRIKKTAALVFMLLFFVGCTTQTKADWSAPFVCNMTVEKEGTSLSGVFRRSLVSCYQFQVTSPQTWSGFTVETKGGVYSLAFEGMQYVSDEAIPPSSMVGTVIGVLDDMARNPTKTESYVNHSEIVFQGEQNGVGYRVVYDVATKNPIRLETDDGICAVMTYDSVVATP